MIESDMNLNREALWVTAFETFLINRYSNTVRMLAPHRTAYVFYVNVNPKSFTVAISETAIATLVAQSRVVDSSIFGQISELQAFFDDDDKLALSLGDEPFMVTTAMV